MSKPEAPKTPRIHVSVAASADEVWRALRDRTILRQWHGWEIDGLEAEIDQIYFADADEDPEQRELVTHGGDRFRVEQRSDGARVTLSRPPLTGDPDWDAYYDEVTEGWTTFLHQLRFALERQAGVTRRTLFFSSRDVNGRDAAFRAVTHRLGVDSFDALPPATRYVAVLAGEDVAGEVWYHSPTQTGLTVDGWGEGLLVVAGNPPTQSSPAGSTMAILSCYGMTDDRLREIEDRWTRYWRDAVGATAEPDPQDA